MATFRPYSPHFIYRWLSDVFAIFNPAGFLDILQWDMLHMAPCLTSDHHHNRLFIKTTGSTEVLYMARVHDQIYHWLDWPCTVNIKKMLPNIKKKHFRPNLSPTPFPREAVMKCRYRSIWFQKSGPTMMDDGNRIYLTLRSWSWRKFRLLSTSR